MRGFEKVSLNEFIKTRNDDEFRTIKMPERKTNNSAGYDFFLPYGLTIKSKESIVISSGIKAFMEPDEVLILVVRSSLGFKYGLRLKNQLGVIDSDYYNNDNNEGHILIAVENTSIEDIHLNANDRIVQGIFIKYLIADNEVKPRDNRIGGIGSTK